jgi:ABC-2 type transport system permease protein
LLKWRLLLRRSTIVWMLTLQTLVSAGVVIGFGFLQPAMVRDNALFVVTGAATLNIAIGGLVVVPQNVAFAREQGTFSYFLALPTPRVAILAADLSDTLLFSLPGVALALVVGAWRYEYAYSVHPLFPIAIAATAVTAAGVGYAIAVLSPSPNLTQLLTQVIIFALFLFAPLTFPAERLPRALQLIHAVLPVRAMGDAVRGTLTDLPGPPLVHTFLVLGGWAAVSVTAAIRALTREP